MVKTNILTSPNFLLLTCCTLLIFCCGCVRTIKYQPIDAISGKPLHNVAIDWKSTHSTWLSNLHFHKGNISQHSDNPVSFTPKGQRSYNFVFSLPDYQQALVFYSDGKGFIESPYTPPTKTHSFTRTSLNFTNPIIVPLAPKESP